MFLGALAGIQNPLLKNISVSHLWSDWPRLVGNNKPPADGELFLTQSDVS